MRARDAFRVLAFGALLACRAGAQDLTDDLAHTAQGAAASSPSTAPATPIDRAIDRDAALSDLVAGNDSEDFRQFVWKFLAPEERDHVSAALQQPPPGPPSVEHLLLAGSDQFAFDRSFRYPADLQTQIEGTLGLPASVFTGSGQITPTPAVIKVQAQIAYTAFQYYQIAGRDPFAPAAAAGSVAPVTDTDRKLAAERQALATAAPFVLDRVTRERALAAVPDDAALARLAAGEPLLAAAQGRPAVPVPGKDEAARRLAWAKGVLQQHGLLDANGAAGLGPLLPTSSDPLVFQALDTLHRYALDGEPLLPSATFPRTNNRVKILFGHKDPELMKIYDQVQAMMDTAKQSIWVDLFYLGGKPGQDNMGVKLLAYLQQRKAQGIEVRLLLSPNLTGFTDPATYDLATQQLGARPYNLAGLPGAIPTKVDHDKLIVVDHGAAAMVGTMNFDALPNGNGGHHETVSLIRGPAAAILAWSHLAAWRLAGGADAPGDAAAIRQAAAVEPSAAQDGEDDVPLWITLTSPIAENTTDRLLDWIRTVPAGDEIKLWMFQFGDRQVVAELAAAIRRGVGLRVLADPLSGPVPQLPWLPNVAGFATLSDAIQQRAVSGNAVHVLDRDALGTYLHSKVAVFGKTRFTLGSTNWTNVGLHRNAEISIFGDSANLAAQLAQRFDSDWQQSSVFPDLDTYRAKHPSWGNVDRHFLDRVTLLMDDFF